MTTDTTPAAIEAMEVARFEMEQVGCIDTIEDGAELITMGVLLSGDEAAIKWAGKHIFSSVVLMRETDHTALAAELTTARAERDEWKRRHDHMADGWKSSDEEYETELATLRKEVERLRGDAQ